MVKGVLGGIFRIEAHIRRNQAPQSIFIGDNGIPGTRAAPAKHANNDEEIGVRLDFGEIITKEDGTQVQQVSLPPNKNVKDGTLKDMANKDSHQTPLLQMFPLALWRVVMMP